MTDNEEQEEIHGLAERIMLKHILLHGDVEAVQRFGEVQGIDWCEFKEKYSEEIIFALIQD